MKFDFWTEFSSNKEELSAANFGNSSCPTMAEDMHTATDVLLKRIANEAELAKNKPERLLQLQNLAVSVTETYFANSQFGANCDITKVSSYVMDNLKNIIGDNNSVSSKHPELDKKLKEITAKKVEQKTPEKNKKKSFFKRFFCALKDKPIPDEIPLVVGVGLVVGAVANGRESPFSQHDEVHTASKIEVKVEQKSDLNVMTVDEYNQKIAQDEGKDLVLEKGVIPKEFLQPVDRSRQSIESSGENDGKRTYDPPYNQDRIIPKEEELAQTSSNLNTQKTEKKSFWARIKQKFNNLINKQSSSPVVEVSVAANSVNNIIDKWAASLDRDNMPTKVMEFAQITKDYKLTSEEYKNAISRLPEEFQDPARHISFWKRHSKSNLDTPPKYCAIELANANEAYKARKEKEDQNRGKLKGRTIAKAISQNASHQRNMSYRGGGGLRGFCRW